MRFSYIARTISGQEQRGTVEALSLENAREDLRKKNLFIDSIRPFDEPVKRAASSWTTTDVEISADHPATTHVYVPLVDTFRLFAGWLLAWYGLIFLLGSLEQMGRLPFEIPFVQALFLSPIILRLAFLTYLFLLLTSMHRLWGKGALKGFLLTLVGVFLYAFFHVNV